MVVATQPTPTLADLLASAPSLAPGVATGVAIDVGHALRDLHAVGLSHGDLAADTVVLTAGGGATLVEVGVLAAVRGAPSDIGHDLRAWAALARSLAAMATTTEAAFLLTAATTAETGDLAYAVRRLAHEARDLRDVVDRESLVDALPSIKPASPRIPRQASTIESSISPVRVRFGRGVPLAGATTLPRAVVGGQQARRRLVRFVWIAAIVAVLALVAGAAAWWSFLR